MAMTLYVGFDHLLTRDEEVRLQLAVAALAKSKRLRIIEGGHAARILGEAMSITRVRDALAEVELYPTRIESSLDDDEDAEADDTEQTSTKERVRAIGREGF